ncbi:Eco29kI restriction endonuclease [Yersinia intermedia]|uniref:Eco29kI family restriction endonuclease n=1 Tax=Yersinia intermedia TaxID=631 RepID=UPI0005E33910|nr:Eco29kI family restriction endonuclease [Yersinia intermedia]MDA5514173.1 Eco29kI family restriction endonuclease [Yersinia intermedia]CQD81093.1 Eco29kI restriction endonuclease [Yersinia intermedia]
MLNRPFDRSEHIYRNDAFIELVKDAVRFFNGTPAHILPPPTRFTGTGVYALYYTGSNPIYRRYAELNRLSYDYPIYVGKAVPQGWRQARIQHNVFSSGTELFRRIGEHSRNISATSDLQLDDFACRFVIFEDAGSDMISTIEAALIKLNRPLWNTVVDGFGNHTPGNGRFQQAKSDWDVIHPGRPWADLCQGIPKEEQTIRHRIEQYFETLKNK